MKNKVAVAMLLSTSLVSLNSAASDAIALSSQYQAASEVNREDVKIEKLKNKIITSFNDVELLGTLKKIEDSLYEVTEDLSNDFIKNYNFSAILIDVVDLESALLKFIDEKLITKVQVKDPLRLIFSIKNKITRIIQIRDSLDLQPSYYDAELNAAYLQALADSTTNHLLRQIRNKA